MDGGLELGLGVQEWALQEFVQNVNEHETAQQLRKRMDLVWGMSFFLVLGSTDPSVKIPTSVPR